MSPLILVVALLVGLLGCGPRRMFHEDPSYRSPSSVYFLERFEGCVTEKVAGPECTSAGPPDTLRVGPMRRESAAPGSLSRASLNATLEARRSAVLACYVQALELWPELQGTVGFRLDIEPDGHVSAAAIYENETDSEPLACCLMQVLTEAHFQAPANGRSQRIYDAVHFKPRCDAP